MTKEEINSLIDQYARTKGMKLRKLEDAIEAELDEIVRELVNDEGEDTD